MLIRFLTHATILLGLAALAPIAAHARSDGSITGASASGGCSCHGGASSNISVSVSGPLAQSGTTQNYTVTIDRLVGGNLLGIGFDVGLQDPDGTGATLVVLNASQTQLVGSDITHADDARTTNTGLFSFTVGVMVPGGLTPADLLNLELTVAGLQFGDPANTNGDEWNFGSAVVPEPTTGLLTGLGLVGLSVARRRRPRA